MKKLFFISTLALLASCGGGGSGGGGGTVQTKFEETVSEDTSGSGSQVEQETATFKIKARRKVELSADFSNLEEFKENINSYSIELKALSGHYIGSTVECKKIQFDGTRSNFYGSFDNRGQKAAVDIRISSHDPSEVIYNCLIINNGNEVDHAEVKLLKSYVVTGKTNFLTGISSSTMGTLLIDKNSTLITEGLDLDLKIRELISVDGKIITFEKDKTASDNRHGSNGGNVKMEVHRTYGKLSVELRGMHAGKQTKQAEKITAVPPRGANGNCRGEQHRNNQQCFGKPGQKGFPGNDGFNGFNGGDTGTLDLSVLEKNSMKIELLLFTGLASDGTPGTAGGNGSAGGIGSHVEWNEPNDIHTDRGCPRCSNKAVQIRYSHKFPDGAHGPNGENGKHGAKGKDGTILESKINFHAEEMHFEKIDRDWKNFN